MNNSLISVILPIYIYNEYITDALNSLILQTYNNIEILIIDDSNDDKLCKLVKNINDSRIKLIKGNKNGGIASLICASPVSGL